MTENIEKISFLLTGGTLDGEYNPAQERKTIREKSIIRDYIETTIKPHFDCDFKTLMMIDSLDMTDNHRAEILAAVHDTSADKIIITHGTSTVVETANYLAQHFAHNKKTIILVGAIIPLVGFYPSDAAFNLGYAVSAVQNQKAGIYICMNGQVFTPDQVQKNLEKSRFEFKEVS